MSRDPALPREFLLAAACCIWPSSERKTATIREASNAPLDWDRFLRVVKRQRVAGLVHDGLVRAGVVVPTPVAERLRSEAAGVVRQNFQFLTEAERIQRLLDGSGVPALFVKGVTLAMRAYGTLGLKHSWDIDLLVDSECVPLAIKILEHAGYCGSPPLPPITDLRYKQWIQYGREYVLRHQANRVHVELHWKLADNDHFLAGISAASPTQLIRFPNQTQLRTLNDDDLFVYLCVHGAVHGWSRLKWLADVAALIAKDSVGELEARLKHAQKVNAEHCVVQTFLLCDRLFATPNLAGISQELRQSRRYRWLERIALKAMTHGSAETELGNGPFDIMSIYASHFVLGRGWRFAINELWNKLNGPYDLLFGALPRGLGFLYPFMRILSWIRRRGRIRMLPIMQTANAPSVPASGQPRTVEPDRTA